MTFTELSNRIFDQAISDYHTTDHVDAPIVNPYAAKSIEFYLYLKNWIDTVQWHLEDIIRDPHIDPVEALALKRRIDKSNQDRTDLVELIDSYFWDKSYVRSKPRCRHQHRKSGLGYRPSVDSAPKNLPHAHRS